MRDAVYKAASDTFGKRGRKNEDWFEAGIEELEPAINAKRSALIEYKIQSSETTLAAYREARNSANRVARKCANDYWLKLCSDIQISAECGNICAMCEGIKKAFGPSAIKIAPLKSTSGDIITDQGKQMERWAEHYQELYSRQNIVTDAAVKGTTPLPTMEELDLPPSIDELRKAIDSLACGKAPATGSHPRSSRREKRAPYSTTSRASFCSAGKRAPSPRTCVTPKSSRCTRTRASAAIATTIVGYPSSALWGRRFLESFSTGFSNLQNACTQSHSAGSERSGRRSTWCSPSGTCRRSAANRDAPSTWPS